MIIESMGGVIYLYYSHHLLLQKKRKVIKKEIICSFLFSSLFVTIKLESLEKRNKRRRSINVRFKRTLQTIHRERFGLVANRDLALHQAPSF